MMLRKELSLHSDRPVKLEVAPPRTLSPDHLLGSQLVTMFIANYDRIEVNGSNDFDAKTITRRFS